MKKPKAKRVENPQRSEADFVKVSSTELGFFASLCGEGRRQTQ